MRKTHFALICAGILLALASDAVGMAPTLHFAAPAQAGPSLRVSGATWALVLTASSMKSSWTLDDASMLIRQEHERLVAGDYRAPYSQHPGYARDIETTDRAPLPATVGLSTQPRGMA